METITKETHIIYKTVDITTGEYYIGLRSWRGDIEPPGYFGSYKKDSDWRPNKKNLVRITLAEYPDRETLKDEEVEWIRPHLGKPLCRNTHNRRLHFDTWGKLGEESHSYGKSLSTETRAKIGVANLGRTRTEESREKLSESHKGKTHTQETRKKISIALSGENNPNWGKPAHNRGKKASPEAIEKQRQAQLGKPKPQVQCPNCGKLGGISQMKRYHFDNCKKNPNRL